MGQNKKNKKKSISEVMMTFSDFLHFSTESSEFRKSKFEIVVGDTNMNTKRDSKKKSCQKIIF